MTPRSLRAAQWIIDTFEGPCMGLARGSVPAVVACAVAVDLRTAACLGAALAIVIFAPVGVAFVLALRIWRRW